MDKHNKLKNSKFSHSKEDLYYNPKGDLMWSLFRTQSNGVTIYYHRTEEFHIISGNKAKHYSLNEIANKWDPKINSIID